MPPHYLDTALRLPAPDIEALIQGRSIAVMPRSFLDPGRVFALYPTDVSHNLLPVEQQYRSNFLTVAKNTISQLHPEGVIIKGWARCEWCQIIDNSESLEVLSPLTIWKPEALQQILAKRPYIFLAYLRVYLLPESLVMSADSQGQFVALPKSINVADNSPILSDTAFYQRREQLEKRLPPLHPELEELQSAITQLATTNPAANKLNEDIKIFLGWNSNPPTKEPDRNLAWINDIADLGNRSKELDQGKSNYQAGTDFENIVRRSLEFLRFKVEYAHKGGAGGLDLFCSQPYTLVSECKSGKKIPNDTAVQLLNLAHLRLPDKETINKSVKLIIGPGEPTTQLKDAAIIQGMSIINPETLEKLVKLQSKYPGAVDLLKLKEYLKPGQSDESVEKYIEQIYYKIKVRSHLVRLVKNFLHKTKTNSVYFNQLRGAYGISDPPSPFLNREQLHSILMELSSPLTGYLGCEEGNDMYSDRFYFLRDLVVDN